MKQTSILATLIVTMLLTITTFSAPKRNPERMQKFLINKLDMNEKQEAEFRTLADTHHKTMIDLEANAKKLHIDLRNMMESGSLEKDKYFAMEGKLIDARNKIQQERLNFFWNVYSMLDGKQKTEFLELRGKFAEKRSAMRGDGFGRGKGNGPGGRGFGGRGHRGGDCPYDNN